MDAEGLRKKLEFLRKSDARFQVFGASAHRYRLAPPVSPEVLGAFEREHRVVLPEDYREFLLHVGNGGAGPFYGVFSLGEMDHGFDTASWSAGDGFVGDLSKPFPYREDWNLDRDELTPPETFPSVEAEDAWHDALDARYWVPVDGAVPICHQGCALRTWLVVTGPERGHVWIDSRADYDGWSPSTVDSERLSFSGWYDFWLEESLRELSERAANGN